MKKLTIEEEKRALELHKKSIIIDSLNASLMDEEYFEKVNKGAMNQNLSETVKNIAQMYKLMKNSKYVTLIEDTEDIKKAKKEGKTGVIIGFQNVPPLEGNLDLLSVYHKLGVRIIQLTYHFK